MKRILLSIPYVIFLLIFWAAIHDFVLTPLGFGVPEPERMGLIKGVSILWFTFGISLAYTIAKKAMKNGYSWWKNFLLYGLLSTGIPGMQIIGIIIGILRAVQLYRPYKCKSCQKKMSSKSTVCKFCGTSLETKRCQKCGETWDKSFTKCPKCKGEEFV